MMHVVDSNQFNLCRLLCIYLLLVTGWTMTTFHRLLSAPEELQLLLAERCTAVGTPLGDKVCLASKYYL
jgi:hypothetical protein